MYLNIHAQRYLYSHINIPMHPKKITAKESLPESGKRGKENNFKISQVIDKMPGVDSEYTERL